MPGFVQVPEIVFVAAVYLIPVGRPLTEIVGVVSDFTRLSRSRVHEPSPFAV